MPISVALLATVLAGGPAVPVSWDAPDACRPADRVREQLEATAPAVDDADAAHVVVRGQPGAWTADVETTTVDGVARRSLVAAECDALADAVAVVIAVSLDPFGIGVPDPPDQPEVESPVQRTAPPTQPPEVEAEPEAEPDLDLEARDPPRREAAPIQGAVRWEGASLWVGGGGEIGMLPALFGSAAGGVDLRFGPLRVGVSGTFVGARRLQHPSGGAALFTLGAAALRLCGVPRWTRLELPLCGGAEAGGIAARGRALAQRGTARSPWVALLLSARVLGALARRWWIWGGVEGLVALRRPGFTIDDFEAPIATVSPGSFRFAAGFEVRFP